MLVCRPKDRASVLENESKIRVRVRKKKNITDLKLVAILMLLLEYIYETDQKCKSVESVGIPRMDGWIYIGLRGP